MNLGIFLSSGDSFEVMSHVGQDDRFKKLYLTRFSENFENIYIFSYANEVVKDLPKNVYLIPNKYKIHRLLYGVLMPLLNFKIISNCDVLRAYHILGTVPAIITKLFFNKNYSFNYGYDYLEFALMEKKYLAYILILLIQPLAFKTSSVIFATTKMVLEWIPKEKACFNPHGVDVKLFKQIKKSKKFNKITIISVGRLEEQKNFKSLILALRGLNVKFMLVGSGSLKNQLVDLARNNKIELKLVDRIDHTKLPAIYNQADILVLPSFSEGHSKVLLEAMACGIPVIGSNVKGINEIIEDRQNGLFCSTDVESIRTKIKELIEDNKLRQNLSKEGIKYVKQNFNLEKLLENEIKIMKKIYD